MTGPRPPDRWGAIPSAALLLTLALPAFSVVATAEAGAQEPLPEPGATVRVRTPSVVERVVRGRLAAVTDSSVVVEIGEAPAPVEILRADVDRLQVRTGSGRASWRGLFVGGAVGTILGITLDQETGRYSPDGVHLNPRTGARIAAAAGGALLGALIGRRIHVDRWKEVDLRRRNR